MGHCKTDDELMMSVTETLSKQNGDFKKTIKIFKFASLKSGKKY